MCFNLFCPPLKYILKLQIIFVWFTKAVFSKIGFIRNIMYLIYYVPYPLVNSVLIIKGDQKKTG